MFLVLKLIIIMPPLQISDNFCLITLLAVSLKKCTHFQSQPNRSTLLCKAMCLANITKFFLLPIVIWKSQQSEFVVQLNFMIVMGYFLFSLIHVYSGNFRDFVFHLNAKITSNIVSLFCSNFWI